MDEVEICSAAPGQAGGNFYLVRDQATGQWRGVARSPVMEAWEESLIRQAFLAKWREEGGTEDQFAETWPARWEEFRRPTGKVSERLFAVLDTGLLSEHPLVKGRVAEAVDFTGEGPEDGNGHGTAVAIRIKIRDIPRYANVKVIKANGRGSPDYLLAGLDWVLTYRNQHPDVPLSVNMSVGLRRTRNGRQCEGDCDVCRAAIAVAESGAMVFAAAGNIAGETTCPGTAGVLDRADIFTVGRLDEETSGTGNVWSPSASPSGPLDS